MALVCFPYKVSNSSVRIILNRDLKKSLVYFSLTYSSCLFVGHTMIFFYVPGIKLWPRTCGAGACVAELNPWSPTVRYFNRCLQGLLIRSECVIPRTQTLVTWSFLSWLFWDTQLLVTLQLLDCWPRVFTHSPWAARNQSHPDGGIQCWHRAHSLTAELCPFCCW